MTPDPLAALALATAASWRHVPDSDHLTQQAFATQAHWSEACREAAHHTRAPLETVYAALHNAGLRASNGRDPPAATFRACVAALLSQLELRADGGTGLAALPVCATTWVPAARILGRHLLVAAMPAGRNNADVLKTTHPMAIPGRDARDAHVHDAPAALDDLESTWDALMRGKAARRNDPPFRGAPLARAVRAAKLEQKARELRSRLAPSLPAIGELCLLRHQVLAHLMLCTEGCGGCATCHAAASYIRTRCEWLELTRGEARLTGLAEFTDNFAVAGRLHEATKEQTKAKRSQSLASREVRSKTPAPEATTKGVLHHYYAEHRKPFAVDRIGNAQTMAETLRSAVRAATKLREAMKKDPSGKLRPPDGIDIVRREIGWHPALWRRFYEAAGENHLFLAMHAGEDMADLLTGVRIVAEAIEVMRQCNKRVDRVRIGHAIAIRVDASAWYAKQGMARPRLWEHALDLQWAWRETQPCDVALRQELRVRWREAGEYLRGCAKNIDIADAASRYGREEGLCEHAKGKSGVPAFLIRPSCTGATELEASQSPTWSPTRAWLSVVEHCQRRVRRIAAEHAVVEVCPTSNADISGLGWSFALDFGTNHLFGDLISVRIGSDDPGVLATSFPLEQQLLREWLPANGMSVADANAWVRSRSESM